MNCCDYECNQGRDCTARATRRVRAGQPVIGFSDEQIARWEQEDRAREAKDERDLLLAVFGVLAAAMVVLAALAAWGRA